MHYEQTVRNIGYHTVMPSMHSNFDYFDGKLVMKQQIDDEVEIAIQCDYDEIFTGGVCV